MKFSVLMSIYHRERAEYFNQAMHSIWQEQTVKPTEIVLVQDGKLTDELYDAIDQWQVRLGQVLKIIRLEKNLGTGDAKNAGLQQCSYDLVAIMDTDDISLPNRFEQQLTVFEACNVDVCGGWIGEFEIDTDKMISYRKVPELHQEIATFAKKRMPVNHVSIMFRRGLAIKAGGYQRMLWLEDYYLMVRMLLKGGQFYNIQQNLVNVRSGLDQLKRRSGLQYALSEVKLQRAFLRLGFINPIEFARSVITRLSVRILPKPLVDAIYKQIRKIG